MARYVRDPDTLQLPRYLRGEFRTIIGVKVNSSTAGTFIDVVPGGKANSVSFIPNWVGDPWKDEPAQLASINKALHNSFLTSFEPSSTPLPPGFTNMRFKTLVGEFQPALAVLIDLPEGFGEPPDPGSVWNVFLRDGDDFALAIRAEDICRPFENAVNKSLPREQTFTFTFHVEGPTVFGVTVGSYTLHTYAVVTPGNATVALYPATFGLNGAIMLSIPVHVHFYNDSDILSAPDDFDFTIMQAFDLVLGGGSVSIQQRGGPSVNIPSNVDSSIAQGIRANATTAVNNAWSNVSAGVQTLIGTKLNVANLQNFLKSLMNPPAKPGAQPVEEVDPQLFYTWYEIVSAGIILHGALQVPAWPKPHIEYAFVSDPDPGPPLIPGMPNTSIHGQQYNALRTWIPGGTVQEYIWKQGTTVLRDITHTFLFNPFLSFAVSHLCLTIKGIRISASGPVVYQPVSQSTYCLVFNQVGSLAATQGFHVFGVAAGQGGGHRLPKIALTRPTNSGGIEIIGHTPLWAQDVCPHDASANVIIHFPGPEPYRELELLTRAVAASELSQTATAIVVVVSPEQAHNLRPIEGILFSDDPSWSQLLREERPPATLVLNLAGELVWRHHGELSNANLPEALKKHLRPGGRFIPRLLQANIRSGQPAPNFLFEAAPGHELTLRKLVGSAVAMVFWNSSSSPSIQTLRDLQDVFARSRAQKSVVLAINDMDPPEVASRIAAEIGFSGIVVADVTQEISRAYGVNIWPTTIFLDAKGLVVSVQYGRFSTDIPERPPAQAAD
jgi:peroxiredoxin